MFIYNTCCLKRLRPLSTVVVQRFCKPKVGSSNLSEGTITSKKACIAAGFFASFNLYLTIESFGLFGSGSVGGVVDVVDVVDVDVCKCFDSVLPEAGFSRPAAKLAVEVF